MSDLVVQDNGLPMLADDSLIQIAKQAEARIDAVIKIKQIALKVTNGNDWCDQDGKPYLEASGSEKVANVFNISWRFLDPEPKYEEEQDGHYTYTYRGEFCLAGRTIEVEGSRSSKDGFFKQNVWENNVKTEKDVRDRDNKRDVKMAALTNLLGNGITRILGIRNLTYADLEKFAGIKQDEVKGVKYKKAGEDKPTMKAPGEKKAEPAGESNGDARTKLAQELELFCSGDIDMMNDVCHQISAFGTNNGFAAADIVTQKDDGSYKISDKWIGTALGSLRKMVEGKQEG